MKSKRFYWIYNMMRIVSIAVFIFLLSFVVGPVMAAAGVCGAVLVGTHTGAVSYTGTIDQPIARLVLDCDALDTIAQVKAAKLTVTQATKRKTGTLIPEIAMSTLADIAGFIDGVWHEVAAVFQLIFSLPISLGGSYDLEGGSLTYSITGATAEDTFRVYAIDDAKRELDYIEITPVSLLAGGVKTLEAVFAAFIFIDPSKLTRIKVNYANGISIEYTGAEVGEIARVVNPFHKNLDGVITSGYETYAGLNIVDAVSVDVNMSAADVVYVVKHLNAA